MGKKNEKYTVEEILLAGEIGEVSMIDVKHVVSLLNEARAILNKSGNNKKYKFPQNGEITPEMSRVMLNKLLEKYNTTVDEIYKTDFKTIDDVFWLDYISLTESEFNAWRDWCRDFLSNNCTPKYSEDWIKTKFSYWSLLYSFNVV